MEDEVRGQPTRTFVLLTVQWLARPRLLLEIIFLLTFCFHEVRSGFLKQTPPRGKQRDPLGGILPLSLWTNDNFYIYCYLHTYKYLGKTCSLHDLRCLLNINVQGKSSGLFIPTKKKKKFHSSQVCE